MGEKSPFCRSVRLEGMDVTPPPSDFSLSEPAVAAAAAVAASSGSAPGPQPLPAAAAAAAAAMYASVASAASEAAAAISNSLAVLAPPALAQAALARGTSGGSTGSRSSGGGSESGSATGMPPAGSAISSRSASIGSRPAASQHAGGDGAAVAAEAEAAATGRSTNTPILRFLQPHALQQGGGDTGAAVGGQPLTALALEDGGAALQAATNAPPRPASSQLRATPTRVVAESATAPVLELRRAGGSFVGRPPVAAAAGPLPANAACVVAPSGVADAAGAEVAATPAGDGSTSSGSIGLAISSQQPSSPHNAAAAAVGIGIAYRHASPSVASTTAASSSSSSSAAAAVPRAAAAGGTPTSMHSKPAPSAASGVPPAVVAAVAGGSPQLGAVSALSTPSQALTRSPLMLGRPPLPPASPSASLPPLSLAPGAVG